MELKSRRSIFVNLIFVNLETYLASQSLLLTPRIAFRTSAGAFINLYSHRILSKSNKNRYQTHSAEPKIFACNAVYSRFFTSSPERFCENRKTASVRELRANYLKLKRRPAATEIHSSRRAKPRECVRALKRRAARRRRSASLSESRLRRNLQRPIRKSPRRDCSDENRRLD